MPQLVTPPTAGHSAKGGDGAAASAGHPTEALTELEELRPLLAEMFGAATTHVRNLDKQIGRLRMATRAP